jgi:ribonuclease P protein component
VYHLTPVAPPRPDAAPAQVAAVQAGFSVPKKKFKRSVDRHRVRRLMVEAWRHRKHLLPPVVPAGMQLHVFVLFTDAALPEYATVEQAMTTATDRLLRQLTPPPPTSTESTTIG